jgi:hypothetical protein
MVVGLQLGIREKAGQGVRDSKVSFDFLHIFFLRNLVTNFSLSGGGGVTTNISASSSAPSTGST